MPELMTKQDAIEYLLYMKHDVYAKSPMDIALDTAIEALKQPTMDLRTPTEAALDMADSVMMGGAENG